MPPRTSWQIQRSVVFALFLREVKGRFGGRLIGAFWVLFEPLVHLLVLTFVVSTLFGRVLPGVDYPVFLVSGIMQFFLFRNLSLRLMNAVDSNRGLFAYRQVKPLDALISRALMEIGLNVVQFVVMIALLGWVGHQFWPAEPVEYFAVWALTAVMGFGLGLNLAVAHGRFPQIGVGVRLVFVLLYFTSGVMFPVRQLLRDYLDYLLWNPVLHLLEVARSQFFPLYQLVPGVSWQLPVGFALVTLMLGFILYRHDRERLLTIDS